MIDGASIVLAILVLTAFGFSIASSLLPSRLYSLGLALAPGMGAGVCAIVFFGFRRAMFTLEFVVLAVAVFLIWRHRAGFKGMNFLGSGAVAVILPALTLAMMAISLRVDRSPHGSWDGWAIWNWEARLLYRAGPDWRQHLPLAFHGDYPLLVSSMTARIWRYMGHEAPEVGAILGILLALSSIAVLVLTLAELRNRMIGTVMGLTLLGTPSYIYWATSHYADIPLAFFFLGTLALIAIHFDGGTEPQDMRLLILAGFLAGCAGWTKNEGILFIIAVAMALLLPVFRHRRETASRLKAFASGAALPVFVITVFKMTNNVQNYVVAYNQGKLTKMFDISRHIMILSYAAKYLFSFGDWAISPFLPLIAFILLTGVHRSIVANNGWRTNVMILVILCAGYYLVYLTTPIELKVHLETSMDRLFMQVWPSFLLLAGLVCERSWAKPGSNLALVARSYGGH